MVQLGQKRKLKDKKIIKKQSFTKTLLLNQLLINFLKDWLKNLGRKNWHEIMNLQVIILAKNNLKKKKLLTYNYIFLLIEKEGKNPTFRLKLFRLNKTVIKNMMEAPKKSSLIKN